MTTPPTGTIYSFRPDRLGGRLNALINAMRLAQVTGAPLRVHWFQDPDVGQSINDPTTLFDAGFVARHFCDNDSWQAVRRKAGWLLYMGPVETATVRSYLAQGRDLLVNNAFGPVRLSDEDDAAVRRDLAAIWRDFPVSPTIAACLPVLRDRIGPDAVAYHIRRGDIISHPREINRPWPDKFIVDEVFRVHIERVIATGARPILFSDDPATIARFCSWYPDLVPSDTLFAGFGPITPGQQDFLELIAMSLCRDITAPWGSAFSQLATMLGGRRRNDVSADLTPAEQTAARDRLLARLSRPDPATVLSRPGEIGQSLWHLDAFMRTEGRQTEATQAIAGQVRAGLDVSFVYPLLMRAQLEGGDLRGALDTWGIMATRDPHYDADVARCNILRAVAHVLSGDPAQAAQAALMAYWYQVNTDPVELDPGTPEIDEVVALLMETGALDGRNFLPVSPVAARLCRRPAATLFQPAFAGFLAQSGPVARHRPLTLRHLAALEWDWRILLRGPASERFAVDGDRAAAYGMLLGEVQDSPSADAESLLAVHDALMGQGEAAFVRLRALAQGQEHDAVLQHRLSIAAVMVRKFRVAQIAAEAAVAAAPGVPASLAWRGRLLRTTDPLRALEDLETALAMGLVVPPVHLLIGEAAGKAGQPARQEAAIDAALALAPRWTDALLARARFQADTGQRAAALETLDRIEALAPGMKKAVALRETLTTAA